MNLIVMAKEPVPGRVKTRLCPPCTPAGAARVASAALSDTLDVAVTVDADPVLALGAIAGDPRPASDDVTFPDDWRIMPRRGTDPDDWRIMPQRATDPDDWRIMPQRATDPDDWRIMPQRATDPGGCRIVPQRGTGLGERLAHAFADAPAPGAPALLIGMDTPQVTAELLTSALHGLGGADAVLGPAADGGWWALGLREPAHAGVLTGVPMSTATTGRHTLAALHGLGLRVAILPELRDVDTAGDAYAVAALCPPRSRFARAVPRWVPA